MNHCIRHYEEPMVAACRTCQRSYCGRCLVFAFGPGKPPYCVGCALAASGIRNGVKINPAALPAAPAVDRKVEKAQRKAEKAATKAQAKAAKAAARNPMPLVSGPQPTFDPQAPRAHHVPGPSQLSVAGTGDALPRV